MGTFHQFSAEPHFDMLVVRIACHPAHVIFDKLPHNLDRLTQCGSGGGPTEDNLSSYCSLQLRVEDRFKADHFASAQCSSRAVKSGRMATQV